MDLAVQPFAFANQQVTLPFECFTAPNLTRPFKAFPLADEGLPLVFVHFASANGGSLVRLEPLCRSGVNGTRSR